MSTSRRSFLKAAGLAVVTTQVDVAAAANTPATDAAQPGQAGAANRAEPVYQFFNQEEAPVIEAAVARLIPADEAGPGAIEAGVPIYIDRQLAGAWGAGERLYRSGPWHEGEPTQGYQLPFTPAELFRNGLRGMRRHVQEAHGAPFEKLGPEQQDAYLETLHKERIDLEGVPSNVFFESLWGMTVEGFFSDPVYGGNVDMIAWKMIGFPGAHANYYHLVDQHGVAFNRPPMSLAQNAHGVIHIHPEIPASTGNALPHAHAAQGGH